MLNELLSNSIRAIYKSLSNESSIYTNINENMVNLVFDNKVFATINLISMTYETRWSKHSLPLDTTIEPEKFYAVPKSIINDTDLVMKLIGVKPYKPLTADF